MPEIHEHYTIQFKIADHDYYVYDFALPMVTLHALYSGRTHQLAKWLKMSPMKQFTTLDTHDGIGVVDVKDILTDEEIDFASNELYKVGANVKRKYSSAEYNNLDIYHATNMMKIVRRLCDELGKTVILVLHEINYAAFYSDYICAFVNGKIAKFGTVQEVITKENLSDIYKVDFEIMQIEGKPLSIYY